MNVEDFGALAAIREHWTEIRAEAEALYRQGAFSLTNSPDSNASFDIGFGSFFKYGWSKFYLRWYGATIRSARELCPKTVALLEGIPTVNGAMFSLLPPGSQLNAHQDPVACSLRYHLGLITPNSDRCYINIDGQPYSWRDGEALMFDETYLHYAKNETGEYRLILMCDIERPLHVVGRVVNLPFKALMRMTVVPNLEGDQRGAVNRVLGGVTPFLQRMKELKRTHRVLYRIAQYTFIASTVLLGIALLTGTAYVVYLLGTEA
jgi:beta-hydroxylase